MSFLPRILSAVAVAASVSSISAQNAPPQGRDVPPAHAVQYPFQFGAAQSSALKIIPAARMSPPDRELVESQVPSIARTPGIEQMRFPSPEWKYAQIECSLFPDQLILRFTRDHGAGDVSMFTAAIRRDGQHRVRVVPVLRRSFALFSQPSVNRQSVSAFNRMLAEENLSAKPDILQVALCYSGIAGANVVGSGQDSPETADIEKVAVEGAIESAEDHRSTIHFTTQGSQPFNWNLEFDRHGRLLKASRSEVKTRDIRQVPSGDALHSRPVPQNETLHSRPVPAPKQPQQ